MTIDHTPGLPYLQPARPAQRRRSRLGGVATAFLALAATFSAAAVQAAACSSTTTLYATTAATGLADGASWASANTLQGALAEANNPANAGQCYEIRVKQGVYKPTSTTDRSISFAITRPLQLKGGYTGTNASVPEERLLNASNTVLSGDIDNNDTGASATGSITTAASAIQGNNSYHVLTVGGTHLASVGGPYTATATDASFTLIEGFSITGGQANQASVPHNRGGGLFCNGQVTCSPDIRHTTFRGNAAIKGGAIYNFGSSGGNSSPVISYATFIGNAADEGGAIYNYGVHGIASPAISYAIFSGNAADEGGAIYSYDFEGNSSPTITHSTFRGNSARSNGGAIANIGSIGSNAGRPIINFSTFSGNSAKFKGGAIYSSYDFPTSITSSILWGNTVTGVGGSGPELYFSDNKAYLFAVQNSIVQGGWAGAGYLGTGNLDSDPQLGPLQDNGGPTFTMVPGAGSPAIDAVVCKIGLITFIDDQRGVFRPQGAQCDIGAVERRQAILSVTVAGNGVGSVSGGLGQCASTSNLCSASYSEGNPLTVTLSAASTVGSTFIGWSGSCSNTSGNCVVTMDQARSVIASFTLNHYTITANATPAAGGGVSCNPNPLNHGSSATCVATAQPGYTFTGWSGNCTGMACVLPNVTANQTVSASFALNQYTVTATATPAAGGSASCSPSPVNHGSAATCTATAQPGYAFTGWGGDCTGMACILANVTANKTLSASFTAVQTSFSGTTVPGAGGTAGAASASFTGGGPTCRFGSAAFVAAPATLPAGQTMPHGMLQFKLVGCDATAVTMSVTWPAAVQSLSKFGKETSAAAQSTHFVPNGLTVSGATTSFTLQDGQQGDDDWTVNGEIVDPVGATVPVANPTPVPTLGQWALVLLSLMAAMLGMSTLRRRATGHS